MSEDVDRLHEKIKELEELRLDRIEQAIKEIMQSQHELEKQMERYSARWGMVLMVGSALLAAIKFFWSDFMKFIGK